MLKILITSFLLTALNFHAQSQNDLIGIELDPAPYLLKGYSVSVKYSSNKLPKVSVMGSIYASDFPDAMMTRSNRDKGWVNLKYRTSYALFADYYLKESRKGFHVGPSLFLYNKTVTLKSYSKEIRLTTLYPNVRIGYIYYPFKKTGFYINPWMNFGTEISTKGPHAIDAVKFKPSRFHYIAALHFGYNIKL